MIGTMYFFVPTTYIHDPWGGFRSFCFLFLLVARWIWTLRFSARFSVHSNSAESYCHDMSSVESYCGYKSFWIDGLRSVNLNSRGEMGNSLIFQHPPSPRPQTWNRSKQQLFYLIALTRIWTRDLWLWYHIELHAPTSSTQKLKLIGER